MNTALALAGAALATWLCCGAAVAAESVGDAAALSGEAVPAWGEIEIGSQRVAPGERLTTELPVTETFSGGQLAVPVFVVRGATAGVTLCMVAGIHGDEVNGVEVVRRVFADISAGALQGTMLGIPIANMQGFRRATRYLPDRRDLNRAFPGSARGSAAARVAAAIFKNVVRRCDALIDLHTASFHRENMLHLRADMRLPGTARLARMFGSKAIIHHPGGPGTLRRAATDIGIPTITVEVGEPGFFDVNAIAEVEVAIAGLLRRLNMLAPKDVPGEVPADGSGEEPAEARTEIAAEMSDEIPAEVPVEIAAEMPADVPAEVTVAIPAEPPADIACEVSAQVPANAPADVTPPAEYRSTRWVRSNEGGILLSVVSLGETVTATQLLGNVIDPVSSSVTAIRAPFPGLVIGRARDQVVLPGFAAYHLASRQLVEVTHGPNAADSPPDAGDDILQPLDDSD